MSILSSPLAAMSQRDLAIAKFMQIAYRHLAITSLHKLNREVLGNTPDVCVIDDPGVVGALGEVDVALQDWYENGHKQEFFRRLLVVWPRETMKTTGVTCSVPIQAHLRNSEIAMAISSVNDETGVFFADTIKSHWAGDDEKSKLVAISGQYKDPTGRRRWSQDAVTTIGRHRMARREPTLRVFSVATGGTSGHFDLVILDDPITAEILKRYDPKTWYDRCWEHYKSLRAVVKTTGMFILVCTRYAEDDLVGHIIQDEILPATVKALGEIPDDFTRNWESYAKYANWTVIARSAVDEETGRLNFPVAWPQARIDDYRLVSEFNYATQLQNRPARRKDSPITDEHLAAMWVDKGEVPPAAKMHAVMTCDFANKASERVKERGDYGVMEIWGHEAGHIYLLNGWYGRETDEKVMEHWIRLLQWAQLNDVKIRCMTYDKPTGGAVGSRKNAFLQAANIEGLRCPPILEISRPGGPSKYNRISDAAYYIQSGMVHMVKGVPGSQQLQQQVQEICVLGSTRFDDCADAFADNFHEQVYRPSRRSEVSAVEDKTEKPWTRWRPAGRVRYSADGELIANRPPFGRVRAFG